MKKNIGNIDKIIRILLALVIIGLYRLELISGVLLIVLVTISAILILTSMLNFCPLYLLFGFNTNKDEQNKEAEKNEPKS